jgi:3-oxoacyl-[acyl-carrier-protein] synthase II
MKAQSMKTRVVITGVGALSALGHSIDAISAASQAAAAPFRHIGDYAGQGAVGLRLKRKLDNFTFHGLCAADMALTDSGVLDSRVDRDRVGVFVGNCLGGWGFTEPKLKALHTTGVDAMGPYVATAWFPAALQGQISLQHDLKGYSKTFSSTGVAGLQAIGYAVEAIVRERADVILVGASEDLSSQYVQAMLARGGARPGVFGPATGASFTEGAAFLVLETLERATARGAKIYAEVTGFADHFCGSPEQIDATLARNAKAASGGRAHLLLKDGGFETEPSDELPTVSSRARMGEMFAVSGVLEAALAARDLKDGFTSARRFADDGAVTRVDSLLIRRLSKQGSVTTLGLSAV